MVQLILSFICSLFVVIIIVMMPMQMFLLKFIYSINAVISTIFLFSFKGNPYSLHKIVNLFILFFFVLANAIQYSNNSIVTSIPIRFDSYDYLNFQFYTLIIILLFNLSYVSFKWKYNLNSPVIKQYVISTRLLLIISIITTLLVFTYYRNALLLLFFRGVVDYETEEYGVETDESTLALLVFGKIIRAMPFACYIIALNYNIGKKVRIILLFLMTLTVFPLGIARNAAAMYWAPVLLIHFKLFEKKNLFALGMIFALLVIFPTLDIFRRWTGDFVFLASLDYLNTMNFDTSQEFMVVLKTNTITYGYQLLGIFVFWIPRSLWITKPVGSGSFMADQYGSFGNISMPFFGEGYINFGDMGVLLFTFFLSWFCSRCDKFYWNRNIDSTAFRPYYLVLIGALLIILRGDLLSSFSYTLATLLDIYVVYLLVRKRRANA